ncbi:MAG: phosphoglucomutase [Desulfurococcaceae archaeon]
MRIHGKPLIDIKLEDAIRIGMAIGRSAGARNLVISGRDHTRVSRMLKRAITAGLMSTGADVMDFHESTVGEISYAIKRFGARVGFMVSVDPSSGGVVVRVYSAPGYELIGGALKSLLDLKVDKFAEPQDVGWIYYAEYMHRLYSSSISSFIRSDILSTKKLNAIAGPDVEPLGTILYELSNSIGLNQTIIGGVNVLKHPSIDLMNRVGKVVDALSADLGVIFSHDGSQLSIYNSRLGYLSPEEQILLISAKYSSPRIIALGPLLRSYMNNLEKYGYDILIVDNEEKLQELTKRERPTLSSTWRGEFITPLFSLGYDAVIQYAQILELTADFGSRILDEINSLREGLSIENIDFELGMRVCYEKPERVAIWGCRVLDENKVTLLIYNPRTDGFIKITDKAAEINVK